MYIYNYSFIYFKSSIYKETQFVNFHYNVPTVEVDVFLERKVFIQ